MRLQVEMTIKCVPEHGDSPDIVTKDVQPHWDVVAKEMATEVESKLRFRRFQASALDQAAFRVAVRGGL